MSGLRGGKKPVLSSLYVNDIKVTRQTTLDANSVG